MAEANTVAVRIDREVYERLKMYSDTMKSPIAAILREMIPDWLETTGEARKEALAGCKQRSNVVGIDTMPTFAANA